ncbi:MAG: MaoC family dehydratase [Pseudomonadota bacterium]|nr:MaoC family dehydratase [Pseudomonadota bacterium]
MTIDPSSLLYFDDLSAGLRFESPQFAVTADAICAFALQFDPQPFHVDADAAEQSFFNGLAASGWHTASITMRLLVDGGLPFAGGLVGAGAEIAWPSATRPGDVLIVFSEIIDLRASASKPDRGWVTVQCETRTSTGAVVQTLRARMLVLRR